MYLQRSRRKGLTKKLLPSWKGPYKITSVDKRGNCTLDMPKNVRRHPVFATDMLKLYHDNPDHQRDTVMDEADEELYIIERIIDHRRHKGKREYPIQ